MTDLHVVATPNAPQAIGPYSQAIIAAGFVYTAGQVALEPATMALVPGDVRAQTERVLTNLAAVLAAAGTSLSRVVKTTVYLTTMDDFAAMNEVYGARFGAHRPARSTVAVRALPKNALVEIDCVAAVYDAGTSRGRIGPGGLTSLQNWLGRALRAPVGSIPTRSRQSARRPGRSGGRPTLPSPPRAI